MGKFILASAALALVLGTATVSFGAFSDDFSVGQASSTNSSGMQGLDTGTTLMNGTFGTATGNRLLQTYIVSNTAPNDARGRTAITAGSGALTFSSDDEVTAYGYVTYSFATPISLALTPAFQFTFLSNDATGNFTIGLTDSTNHTSAVTYTLPFITANAAPLVLTVPANVVGVTTASISQVVFYFGGTKSEDLSIDSIVAVAVPEPGAMSLVLATSAALVGAGWLARRRRQA